MYAGVHQSFLWELGDDELRIESSTPMIGLLKAIPISNYFNNAEQATWFAQGKIDLALDELQRLEAEKNPR